MIIFAQANVVDDPINDFSVASKFTSGIDHRHLDPSSFSLKVPFSASSSITPSTRFLDAKFFIPETVIDGHLHQVPLHQIVINAAVDLLIKELETWMMELRISAIQFRTSPRSRKAAVLMV